MLENYKHKNQVIACDDDCSKPKAAEAFFKQLDAIAMEMMSDQNTIDPMVCYYELPSGEVLGCTIGWDNQAERVAALGRLRDTFEEANAIRYGLIAEAWTPSSQDPDRKEVVVLIMSERGREAVSGFREIIRSQSSVSLGPLLRGTADGWMAELLGKPTSNGSKALH